MSDKNCKCCNLTKPLKQFRAGRNECLRCECMKRNTRYKDKKEKRDIEKQLNNDNDYDTYKMTAKQMIDVGQKIKFIRPTDKAEIEKNRTEFKKFFTDENIFNTVFIKEEVLEEMKKNPDVYDIQIPPEPLYSKYKIENLRDINESYIRDIIILTRFKDLKTNEKINSTSVRFII